MNKEKAPLINVIFYVLVTSMSVVLLVLWADVDSFSNVIALPNRFTNSPLPRKQQLNVSFSNKTVKILMFNPPKWMPVKEKNNSIVSLCEWSNCRLTRNKSNIQSYTAIIFHVTRTLPKKPPISPSNRNPNQVWIFAWKESPVNHGRMSKYKNKHWRNTVNWTMTYTYDADVFYPYGEIRKRSTPLVKNYSEIFHRKTKMAAWVVSNCHTQSKRETYVKKLQKNGVEVDVFGICAGKRRHSNEMRNEINSNYKFYLSFENSLCKDYITEKFFTYFQYDVLLVVRGGGNYSSLLPNDSYINTADFGSIKELAEYLLDVGSSEKKYSKYLMNKDRFESTRESARHSNKSFCYICEKLNNLERNRRTYTDLVTRVHDGTCFRPTDIK